MDPKPSSQTNSPSSPFKNILITPFEGFNRFILSDLRDGRLSLRGLTYPTVVVVCFGFAILFLGVSLTLFSPFLRQNFELMTLQDSNRTLRGASIPTIIVPITLFFLSVSWGFLLTGAIRSSRWIRALVFFLYYTPLFPLWSIPAQKIQLSLNLAVISYLLLALMGSVIIPIFMFWRRRHSPRPGLEFCVLFVLSLFNLQLNQTGLFQAEGVPGNVETALLIESYFSVFTLLLLPFFIQIGMGIAQFVLKLSFWTGEILYFRFSRRFQTIYAALAILTGLQLISVLRNTISYFQQTTLSNALLGYIGSAVTLVIVWGVWWLLNRINNHAQVQFTGDDQLENTTNWLTIPASLLLINIGYIAIAALLLSPFFIIPRIVFERDSATELFLNNIVIIFNQNPILAPIFAAVVSIIWGVWLTRKNQLLSGFFVVLFGLLFLWSNLVQPGQILDIFNWIGRDPTDFWWSIFLLIILINWLKKGELTLPRAISLLILTMVNTLIFRQTGFIEEPLYRLLEFTGAGIIAFGVIWDMITVGDWANQSSPFLPRESRIFLYLGYVILAASAVVWAITQHDYAMVEQFTGGGALSGLERIGKPMLYMLYPLLLTLPKDDFPIKITAENS